jgi:hypothetical protein
MSQVLSSSPSLSLSLQIQSVWPLSHFTPAPVLVLTHCDRADGLLTNNLFLSCSFAFCLQSAEHLSTWSNV